MVMIIKKFIMATVKTFSIKSWEFAFDFDLFTNDEFWRHGMEQLKKRLKGERTMDYNFKIVVTMHHQVKGQQKKGGKK